VLEQLIELVTIFMNTKFSINSREPA
jgi:hypothetical protein